jgi:hypothetical protein
VLTLASPPSAVPRMESSASARLPQVQSHQIEPAKVRIGTAGWSYKDWDGIFY